MLESLLGKVGGSGEVLFLFMYQLTQLLACRLKWGIPGALTSRLARGAGYKSEETESYMMCGYIEEESGELTRIKSK